MNKILANKYWVTFFVVVILGIPKVYAQNKEKPNRLNGEVSYATSENIYLRFKTTEPLIINDTVYLIKGAQLQPCLIIQQKSSVSCIASVIDGCIVNKGDQVVYFYQAKKEDEQVAVVPIVIPSDSTEVKQDTLPKLVKTNSASKPIYGRISLANYTSLNGTDANNRTMARLALHADEIGGTGLSFRSYMNYRQSAISRGETNWDQGRFNAYELALDYQVDESLKVTAGRFINRKMASVGAIDGVALDKSWNTVYVGIIGGFRPDAFTYGLNTNLFQLGAYAGLYHGERKSSFSNIGFVNQDNSGATDRRYLFFQHQSSLGKKVNLFASAELDLYNETDTSGTTSSSPRLTSLYFSVNYRPTQKLSISASYDVRQNVILYQSYEDRLENLLAYDPIRTGIRFSANYAVTSTFRTGINLSFRTQNDQRNDYYGAILYFSLSRLPTNGNLYLALSLNENSAFKYQSAYLRYMLNLAKNKVSITPYYRFVRHSYTFVDTDAALQHYTGLDCSFRLTKLLSLGALYEYNLQQSWTYHRFNINLIQRF